MKQEFLKKCQKNADYGTQGGKYMAIQNILEAYGSDLVGAHVQVGGGGHTIVDSDGTSMAQQPNMKFADSFVTNDSVGEATVVENVKEVASADYSSETEDGMYLITDGEGAVIGPASDDKVEVTADGVKTYAELLNELFTEIDQTKLTNDTKLVEGNLIHSFNARSGGHYYFGSILFGSTSSEVGITIDVTSSQSKYVVGSISSATSVSDNSSTKPADGTKLTLYYGNKKATVDLQTTANRCWMSNGESVEWGMGEKTTLCTMMSAETVFNMTQASVNYAVQHSGFYSITVVNANNVTHDSDINIGGVAIASQYFTYHYQRYSANLPLKAGTQITINGTNGDGVIINYGWGTM